MQVVLLWVLWGLGRRLGRRPVDGGTEPATRHVHLAVRARRRALVLLLDQASTARQWGGRVGQQVVVVPSTTVPAVARCSAHRTDAV